MRRRHDLQNKYIKYLRSAFVRRKTLRNCFRFISRKD